MQPESIGEGESVEAIFDDKFIDSLLEEVSSISEVTLIHFVENTMWVTFKEGAAALAALKLNGIEVGSKHCPVVCSKSKTRRDQTSGIRMSLLLINESLVLRTIRTESRKFCMAVLLKLIDSLADAIL